MIKIDCEEKWFNAMKNELKTIEGRKANKYPEMKVGDVVIISNSDNPEEEFKAKITKIVIYEGPNALRKYLMSETLEKTLPSIKTIEEGEEVYRRLVKGKWTNEQIDASGGMKAIHISKL